MDVAKANKAVLRFFQEELEKTGRVIELQETPEGCMVLVETVEESDYMRRIARDDMVAVYEVKLNQNFEVTAYRRKSMRVRSEVA